jgi:cytochrome c1
MNRQVNYIIHAFLYLVVIGSGYWFIQKLSVKKTSQVELTTPIPQNQNTELTGTAAKGKTLFMSKCASCHVLFKNMTGPGLLGFEERGPWTDRKNVYEWIRNPSAFMAKNEYARKLKESFGTMMTGFPEMTNEEIDAICDYINQAKQFQSGMPIAER